MYCRSFLRRLLVDKSHYEKFDGCSHVFSGKIWLFEGVQSPSTLVYHNELEDIQNAFRKNFEYIYSFSKYESKSNKEYIQHKLIKYIPNLIDVLDSEGSYIYICGLKDMMQDLLELINLQFREKRGTDANKAIAEWKTAKKWNVEVY